MSLRFRARRAVPPLLLGGVVLTVAGSSHAEDPPTYGNWRNQAVLDKHGIGQVKLGASPPAGWVPLDEHLLGQLRAIYGPEPSTFAQDAAVLAQRDEIQFLSLLSAYDAQVTQRLPHVPDVAPSAFVEPYGKWSLDLPALAIGDHAYIAFAETSAQGQVDHVVAASPSRAACDALRAGLATVYGDPDIFFFGGGEQTALVETGWMPVRPGAPVDAALDVMWGWGASSRGDPESYRYWYQGHGPRQAGWYCALHALNRAGFEAMGSRLRGPGERAAQGL